MLLFIRQLFTLCFFLPCVVGYKKKVDSSSPMCMAKQRKVNIAAARKKEEYENNMELLEISNVYQKFKVCRKIANS